MDQNHGLTPLEKVNFSTFRISCFYSLERRFFVLEYCKRHFPSLYCLKRKGWKKAICGPKPWVNPFWKNVNFSTFWTSSFCSLDKRFFVLEYRKRHIPGLYCLKRKGWKMAIFGPKPWVNPFGKMSIFWSFSTSCFYSLKGRFFVLEYPKRNFPGLYFLKKKNLEKRPFLDQNHGLTPVKKRSIFWLFELLVFIP